MNLARLNFFDETNAATLCAASAAAYLDFPDCFRETSTDTQVHIASSETDVIVAFRGTIDVRNWITDLDCTWVLEEGCRIHRGFARALDSAQAQLDAEVFSARSTGRRVWLTRPYVLVARWQCCARGGFSRGFMRCRFAVFILLDSRAPETPRSARATISTGNFLGARFALSTRMILSRVFRG